jgi:LAO/AO transport system kinase
VKKSESHRIKQIHQIRASRIVPADVQKLASTLREGSRTALARCISIIESQKQDDRIIANALLRELIPHSGNSIRIGISGVPGAGKSTFIEAFGSWLCSMGRKVAVLAVDPSSELSKGSILGDKTRMNELAVNERAFIRPSPSAGNLGGVARRTRESIYLCEAAGFDTILVETVGVGQNEIAVHHMVDLFLLLSLAGAGDELQGIKRGITELADIILVNKADGDNLPRAKAARQDLLRAMHFMPEKASAWVPEIILTSALEKKGLKETWENILRFEHQTKQSDYFYQHRKNQQLNWFQELLKDALWHHFMSAPGISAELKNLEFEVMEGKKSSSEAVEELMSSFFSH